MKSIIIIVVVALILVVLGVLSYSPVQTNNAINAAFNPVDYSCKTDADCRVVAFTDCTPCGFCARGTLAINANWHPLCPLYQQGIYACPLCLPLQPTAYCDNGICKINTTSLPITGG